MALSKKTVLTALSAMKIEDVQVGEDVVTNDDIQDYIQTALEQIDKRAEAAHKKQAEKRAAGDQLRADIKAVLDETPKTISDIVTALDNADVTNAMVVSRLAQLVKLGEVFKSDIKVDGRTIKAYSTVEVVTN